MKTFWKFTQFVSILIIFDLKILPNDWLFMSSSFYTVLDLFVNNDTTEHDPLLMPGHAKPSH